MWNLSRSDGATCFLWGGGVLGSSLEELFLCLNQYRSVRASSVACPTLRLLHITDNSLKDWADVRRLGSMFPTLDTLVMANNSLASIQDGADTLGRLFPHLRTINLNNSGQSSRRCSEEGGRAATHSRRSEGGLVPQASASGATSRSSTPSPSWRRCVCREFPYCSPTPMRSGAASS